MEISSLAAHTLHNPYLAENTAAQESKEVRENDHDSDDIAKSASAAKSSAGQTLRSEESAEASSAGKATHVHAAEEAKEPAKQPVLFNSLGQIANSDSNVRNVDVFA